MKLAEKIANLCLEFDGRVGVATLDLCSNEQILFNAGESFPTASVIKLAVLGALMHQCDAGQASLDEPLMLRKADKIAGSGLLQFLTPGVVLPVRDWAFLMMNISDNLATTMCLLTMWERITSKSG